MMGSNFPNVLKHSVDFITASPGQLRHIRRARARQCNLQLYQQCHHVSSSHSDAQELITHALELITHALELLTHELELITHALVRHCPDMP